MDDKLLQVILDDIKDIKQDLKKLSSFEAKVIGAAFTVSFILPIVVSIIFNLIEAYLKTKGS